MILIYNDREEKGVKMLVLSIVSIIAIYYIGKALYFEHQKKVMPKVVYQKAKDDSELRNKMFCKSFVPCIYDMRALHEAYEKGLPRLNDIDLCNYFAYPKEYVIDEETDHLIVNNIDLGPAPECCLLQIGYSTKEYGYNTNYGMRYYLIKDTHNGHMIIEDYKYNDNFITITNSDDVKTCKNFDNEIEAINHSTNSSIKNMTTSSENAFKKFGYVLPKKYRELYEDFQQNDYSSKEMYDKLHNLYKECRDKYNKVKLETDTEYLQKKEALRNKTNERVGKFWAGFGAETHLSLNRFDSEEKLKDYNKYADAYKHTGYDPIDLLSKYKEDEEIIREYDLE